MTRFFVLMAALLPLTLLGCKAEGPTFVESVQEVYAPCDAEPIKLKTAEKGLQLAFEPCGSNNFMHFSWSPDGLAIYYQANQGGWVRKDTGENYPLRIGFPRAGITWVTKDLIAYPDGDGHKIGLYRVDEHILNLVEIHQLEAEQLTRGQEADAILYLAAETPGGVKEIMRLHANTAETEKAFLWMDQGVEEFTYRRERDIVCYRELGAKDVTCARAQDGSVLHRVRGRTRGSLSIDGRYLVTEGDGKPVKVFDEAEGERPSFLPEEIIPPALWITDIETGEEVAWEGVHGTKFQWYDAAPYFGSFMLWGFDGSELNRNVTLGDLRNYMVGQGWQVPR